ncbi:hypothetical protein pipiens_002234 [Culex pipiens pipiens]|uniref:Odorant receptor n=1 Tax=Culex pipiens pipiens TaxID=38569 RepID=A0ABD1DHN9_CULPP
MEQVNAKDVLPMRWFARSYEMHDYNLLFIRWLADFCGVDVLYERYRFSYKTAMCVCCAFFGAVFTIYSFFYYYPDIYKMCEVFALFGIVLQGSPKLYFAYYHQRFYRLQCERLRNLHYKYRNHEKLHAKLLLLTNRIHILTKLLALVFVFGALGYTLYPLYMYFAHGELVLIDAMRLPWIDADTYNGYVVTTIVQIVMLYVGCLGMAAADTIILLFVANLIAYVYVFKNDLEELNTMVNAEDRNEQQIRRKVRIICSQHQDIIEYESDLDERYIVICFTQIIGSVSSLSGYLFLVYMVNFIPGYGLILATICQLLEFCLLGTVLTVKNEEIIQAIYNAHWYRLQRPELACFALMLHKSQNFIEMTVGGFAPLNLETFVAIMNRIYTYFMMLISFIE